MLGVLVGPMLLDIARAEESIAGTVIVDPHTQATKFGVQTSDEFDAEQTRARAESALADGNFESAFHGFLAVCSTGGANSCLQAAQIAEAGHVPKIPKDLTAHLYAEACANGIQDACDANSGSK